MAPATVLVLILSMLMGLQPVAVDMYLPGLPAMSQDFGVPVAQVQFTLSAMLLSFGVSQLLWGPLSDRFGRRPVLLAGMGLFVLASLACMLAPTLAWLVAARMVQGVALGAAVMTARAVVRDRYAPSEGARAMSKALTGLGLVACMGAPLGGLLAQLHWRATLAGVLVVGLLALAVIAWRFDETLASRRLNALQPRELWGTWLRIARHPRFLAFSLVASASNTTLFTYLGTSSFVLIGRHGLSQLAYGLCISSMSLSYVLGTLVCRRLLMRLGLQRTMDLGAGLSLAAGAILLSLFAAGVDSVWAIVLPVNLFLISHGINQPCSQNGAISPFPEAAGTAAALNGFSMMMCSFLMGLWLGTHMDGSARPLVQGMAFWVAVIPLGSWVLVRRLAPLPHSAH
jgi:DHA1 family bicyclomycin/chloramphenicol resistance-like MFS transporter